MRGRSSEAIDLDILKIDHNVKRTEVLRDRQLVRFTTAMSEIDDIFAGKGKGKGKDASKQVSTATSQISPSAARNPINPAKKSKKKKKKTAKPEAEVEASAQPAAATPAESTQAQKSTGKRSAPEPETIIDPSTQVLAKAQQHKRPKTTSTIIAPVTGPTTKKAGGEEKEHEEDRFTDSRGTGPSMCSLLRICVKLPKLLR